MSYLTVFLIAVVLLLLAVAGMSLGVMFGRKPISGSCGGFANGVAGQGCSLCSRKEMCTEAASKQTIPDRCSPAEAGCVDDGDSDCCSDSECEELRSAIDSSNCYRN